MINQNHFLNILVIIIIFFSWNLPVQASESQASESLVCKYNFRVKHKDTSNELELSVRLSNNKKYSKPIQIKIPDGCKSDEGCGSKVYSCSTKDFEGGNCGGLTIHFEPSKHEPFNIDGFISGELCPGSNNDGSGGVYVDFHNIEYHAGGENELCISNGTECRTFGDWNWFSDFRGEKSSEWGFVDDNENPILTQTQPKNSEEKPIENPGEPPTDCYLGDPTKPEEPAYYVQFGLNVLKYLGIIALVVFSIIDFVKAAVSQNNDLLKKATGSAVKRLIYAIGIFFLPIILNYFFNLFGLYCELG